MLTFPLPFKAAKTARNDVKLKTVSAMTRHEEDESRNQGN